MTSIINTDDFDWEFYLLFNGDVIKTFGYYKYAALMHYNMHGKAENRIINENILFKSYPHMVHFDTDFYRENNKDLQSINNRFELINHYLFQGCNENRKIHFNTSIYPYFSFVSKEMIKVSEQPLLTIIMPVYNRAELLSSAIDSILNQSYLNFELIIVDDNSNTDTKNIISKYNKHEKITIMTNSINYGCYTSINLALNLCNGDYITIHGSDDISFSDRYMKIIYNMMKSKLLMCGNYIFRSHFDNFKHLNINSSEDIFKSIITQNVINKPHNSECCKPLVSLGTLTYHRSVFDNLGSYENIRKGGDMVFFENFLHHYENITFNESDCSHRYLTKYNSGQSYKIIDEILYLSAEMDNNNITGQNINFDINAYRNFT